ncbi:GNAT family N-acetyltransferase [Pontibacter sp. G13]|uniref:GNAT family N-acetyltransferase n=1 Tax=Pontibacter sp. G13 TaxID=3074898 RepID=UPI00288C2579|nr:GNAT family N-acetyltransferase [Pontibacter sp. G13]WNJ19802.1 GNAT family N-acetyltransferase [Pontibacter sp. G13]
MHPHIRILPADRPVHWQAVRSLLWEYMSARGFDPALGDYQRELDGLPGEFQPPQGALLVAYQTEVPVGCIAFRRISQEVCEMKRMYVTPNARGLGIGRMLIEELEEAARHSGYQIMKLDTHPSMLAAQRLYTSLGFQEIERYNQNPTLGIRFFGKSL